MNKRYEVNFVNEKIGCGETYKTFSNKAEAIALFYDTIFRK